MGGDYFMMNSLFKALNGEKVEGITYLDVSIESHLMSFGAEESRLNGGKPVKISYEDGVKFYFEDNSFVICRFSGTEPLLRIFAEASAERKGEKLIQTVKEFIK